MTRFLVALLFCVVTATPVLAESPALYFSALPELPIPAGLTEEAHSAIRFDQPEGRIIALKADGSAPPSQITDFYSKTLPSLGWKADPNATGRYVRGNETLIIETRALPDGNTRLKILVRPL